MRIYIYSFLCAAFLLLFGCKDQVTNPPDNAQVSLTVWVASRLPNAALLKSSAAFLAGGGSSVIVEGMTYKAGIATPFLYSAMIRVEQEYDLDPPIVVSADNPNANVTLAVYMAGWFMWNGMLLDPNESSNYLPIKWSIENSFWMYEDEDGDGDDDD